MFSRESRRTRRSDRERRRPDIAVVESLETRELLSFSPLGFSLPDLSISGFASPAASWGGQVTVTANVHNLGASTIVEPLAQQSGSLSSADAPASTVAVYAVRNPHRLKGGVLVGQFNIPAIPQNSAVQITSTLAMPTQPAGFPGDGGKIFLVLVANSSGTVFESDATNNATKPIPVLIEAPLPELAAVGLDVPPVMQPGDTIQPNIRVANLGPADTATQGPLQIALVASVTPNFTAGSSIVALYTVDNIPGISATATQGLSFADANQTPQNNVLTIAGAPVTLPISPQKFFLGVVVDPFNQIKQLGNVPQFRVPKNRFSLSHVVGPPIANLPPAGVLVAGGVSNAPVFPIPFGALPVGGSLDGLTFPAPYPPAPFVVGGTSGTSTVATSAALVAQTGISTATTVPKAGFSVGGSLAGRRVAGLVLSGTGSKKLG